MQVDSPPQTSPLEPLRAIVAAQARTGQDWVRERGLTLQQAFVLTYLADKPGAMQRDIAHATRTTPANITGVLRGLEARALITRSTIEGDERSKRVSATPAGVAAVAGHEGAMAAADEALLAPLTDSERAAFIAALAKIAAPLD